MDWRTLAVSADRSHHTKDGRPAYAARYLDVLKFHEPGLAAAQAADGAMHIDLEGRPAYAHRYRRSFGFYEGLAAVHADNGWFHVRPDGAPAYAGRFAWCGNFQGGRCAVRDPQGLYLHLRPDGTPAYEARWRYVGDVRDGIAVAQRRDGTHIHIGLDGAPVHRRHYSDLDVFHKGFARARDPDGWMHIGLAGDPIYDRRFAAVEPFYNGQARVERFDGAIEVIDESGATVLEVRAPRRSGFAALSADLVGFWRTEAIAGAVSLGVIEALPGAANTLADAIGLDAGHLEALLRALCELGLVEVVGGRWALTERGRLLRADHPETLADAALEYAGPLRAMWARLPDAMRSGAWQPPDVFAEVAADADRTDAHHRMLRSYARHDYREVPAALQLPANAHVIDAGGGLGVLSGLILDAYRDARVTLLERSEVAARVPPRPRQEVRSCDLYAPWPCAADAVVLARVIHDASDARALAILGHARAALDVGGRVYLVELLLGAHGRFGGLCDLHLLLTTGGRERTAQAYASLLEAAGFAFHEVRPAGALVSVVVGVAA